MDVEIDGDVIRFDAFVVAKIQPDAPASVRARFEDFIKWSIDAWENEEDWPE